MSSDPAESPEQPRETDSGLIEIPPTILADPGQRRPPMTATVGGIPREIPVRLGKYLIDTVIGHGAMGVVYKARQEGLDRVVALKILIQGAHASPASVHRFEREARAIAKLRHPNIVSIHEVGDYEGQPFFTMDFIDGAPLDTFIRQTRITSTVVLAELCATICDAVQYAHEQGIVHRDLKPGNILVDRSGKPIVTDFGLAKDIDEDTLFSMTGDIMGTPAFMSPEQAEGHVSETAYPSDVYSLGAILYSMLSGKPPFEGKTLVETLGQVINKDPMPLTHTNPEIEGELGAICLMAMEKDPARRYPTASAMADDLRAFINGYPVSAKPWTWRRGLSKFIARHNRELAGVAVAIALLAVVGVLASTVFSKSYLDVAHAHLASADARVRSEAVATLFREVRKPDQLEPAQVPEAAALLFQAAGDEDIAVQRALLNGLTELGPPDAVRKAFTSETAAWLMATADQNDDPELRNQAIAAIGQFRRNEFVDYLLDRLDEPNPAIRLKIVRSLGYQASRKALGPLLNLRVYDPICRAEAEVALERFYTEGRIALFGRQDQAVKSSLRNLGDAMAAHNQQLEEIASAIDTHTRTYDGPLGIYEKSLAEGSAAEKQQAVYELGNTGDRAAARILLPALRDPVIGAPAAYALARVDPTGSRPALVELLEDSDPLTRANAALAIGFGRQTDSVDDLLVALNREGDLVTRETIVRALGELGSPAAIPSLREAADRDGRLRNAVDQSLEQLAAE